MDDEVELGMRELKKRLRFIRSAFEQGGRFIGIAHTYYVCREVSRLREHPSLANRHPDWPRHLSRLEDKGVVHREWHDGKRSAQTVGEFWGDFDPSCLPEFLRLGRECYWCLRELQSLLNDKFKRSGWTNPVDQFLPNGSHLPAPDWINSLYAMAASNAVDTIRLWPSLLPRQMEGTGISLRDVEDFLFGETDKVLALHDDWSFDLRRDLVFASIEAIDFICRSLIAPRLTDDGNESSETTLIRTDQPLAKFPTSSGLQWRDVTITFVSNDSIRVAAKGVSKRFTFSEIGFKDGRKGDLPNALWDFLHLLARMEGTFSWADKGRRPTNATAKNVSKLRKKLKSLMGLDDDPFLPYSKSGGYRCKFTLRDESYS